MKKTPHYRFGTYNQGNLISSEVELDRSVVADNQLKALADIVGDGVLSGWHVCYDGSNIIEVSPGSGFINGVLHKTLAIKKKTIISDVQTAIYMQSKMFGSSTSLKLETESPSSNIASGMYIDSTPPAAPTGFAAVSVDFDVINLTWNANSETDFDHYEIRRATNILGPYVVIASPTTNGVSPSDPFQDTGLTASTAYYYEIFAIDRSGNYSLSAPVATTTTLPDIRVPAEPSGLQLFPGNTLMSVIWNETPTTGAKYKVTILGLDNDGSTLSTASFDDITTIFYQLTGLVNGRRYRVTVQSKSTTGIYSNGTSAETTPIASAAPMDALINSVAAVTSLTGAVKLDWLANPSVTSGTGVGQRNQYKIRVIRDGVESAPITGIGLGLTKTVPSYLEVATVGFGQMQLLEDDVLYTFRITTLDAVGNESPGVYVRGFTNDITLPADPRLFQVESGDQQVSLTWRHSASADVVSYVLNIDAGADIDIDYLDKYVLTGLTNNVQITIKLRAKDDNGNISSPGVTVTTIPLADTTAPAIPSALQGVGEDSQISLQWTANAEPDLSHYILKRVAVAQTLNAPPTLALTPITELPAVIESGQLSAVLSTTILRSAALVGEDYTGFVFEMTTGLAAGQKATIQSMNVPTGQVTLATALATLPNVGDNFVIKQTHASLGTLLRNVGTATEILDTELLNEQVYAYYLSAVDLRGNASDFSPPILVAPNVGSNDLNAPDNLVLTVTPGSITLDWDQITPTTSHPAFDHTAFNVYRSTNQLSGFVLLDSVPADVLTYTDNNLLNGQTYYYIVTAVRDNAEVLADTGSIQPPNTVLLANVKVTGSTLAGCNIDEIENAQRIVAGLLATLQEETRSRLLLHKHDVKPANSTTVEAVNLIAMISGADLSDVDFTTLSHSPESATYYKNLITDKTTGTEIVYDAQQTYFVSPSNVIWNVPYVGDFKVLVNGDTPSIEFSIDHGRNAIIFSSALADADVVTLDGSGFSYYVPAKIDLGYRGFDVLVDGASAAPFVDEQVQTLRFLTPLTADNVVEVVIEPVIPDYGTQQGARQISLSPNIVLSDFVTQNNETFVSQSGGFTAGDTVFVLVNNERTTLQHAVDFITKSITFDDPLSSTDIVALEVLNKEEVQGLLAASRIEGINGSQFSTGVFLKPQLEPISHAGRIKERASPLFQTLTTSDKYAYAAGEGILGGATTPYSVYQFPSGDLLMGTSNGLLKNKGFAAFLAEGESLTSIIDYNVNPPGGLKFESADADTIVNATRDSEKFGGAFNGAITINTRTISGPNLRLMDNNKILVSGGMVLSPQFGGIQVESSQCYLYDIATQTFAATGTMNTRRSAHASVVLPDGNVLVCGGTKYTVLAFDSLSFSVVADETSAITSTEIYDTITESWATVDSMNTARWFPSLVKLDDDTLLVCGGLTGVAQYFGSFKPPKIINATPTETAELYSISGGGWTSTVPMNKAHVRAEAKVDNGVAIIKDTGVQERELFTTDPVAKWIIENGQTEKEKNAINDQFGLASIDAPVKQMLADSLGLLLLVSHKNVYASEDGEAYIKMKGLEAVGVVHRISQDAAGTLYAATDLGVYEITPDIHDQLTWFQGGLIGQGTTETFDLQPVGSYMFAATEIGIFRTSDSGDTWVEMSSLQDVFNLEAVGDLIFANSGRDLYRSDDGGLTWTKVSTLLFLDRSSRLVGRTPYDLFFVTGTGLYYTRDAVNFNLVDFDRNRDVKANNVHMAELIGSDLIVGYDNELFSIDTQMNVLRLAAFPGSVPTVRLNGTEVRNGFRYDLPHNQVLFEYKSLVDDVVEATSNYALFEADNGEWHSKKPNASVLVFVNGKVVSDSNLTLNAFLGQVSFSSDLKKTDLVTISIAGTTLNNEGELFHDELEDRFELEKGLPLSMGRDHAGNILQMGLSVEHNFLERGIERNQYYCLTGVEVDRSFTAFLQNAEFYVMGRREFDRFNSTLDYRIESEQNDIGLRALVPLAALEVSSKLWVGTENGIFVLDPLAAVPFSLSSTISIERDVNPVRDLKFFFGNVYAAAGTGIYSSDDGGVTFERNIGNGLPDDIFVMNSLNNILLVGTNDTIYYSDGLNQSPPYSTWFRAAFVAGPNDPTEIVVSGTCNAVVIRDGNAYASIGDAVYLSTDGKKWQKIFEFDEKDKIAINCMAIYAKKLFLGTNKGVYNDDGSARSDQVSFRLELTDGTSALSAELNVSDMHASTDGNVTYLYVVGNKSSVYRLANEAWTSTSIPEAKAIQKFIIVNGTRQVALANDNVFVQ